MERNDARCRQTLRVLLFALIYKISRLVGELQLQVNPFHIRYKDLMRMVGFGTNTNANIVLRQSDNFHFSGQL